MDSVDDETQKGELRRVDSAVELEGVLDRDGGGRGDQEKSDEVLPQKLIDRSGAFPKPAQELSEEGEHLGKLVQKAEARQAVEDRQDLLRPLTEDAQARQAGLAHEQSRLEEPF